MKITTSAVLLLIVAVIPIVFSAIPVFKTTDVDGVDGDLSDTLGRGIYENTPNGTLIGQLQGKDADNDQLYYSCAGAFFKCLNDGRVYIEKQIDKEKVLEDGTGTKFTVVFTVRDNFDANTANKYEKSIEFNIQDQNDNPPIFVVGSYNAFVNENDPVGTTFYRNLVIEDRDEAQHAEMTVECYSASNDPEAIIACEHFNVSFVYEVKDPTDQRIGTRILASLYLIKPVDYEIKSSYVMSLLAKDNPNLKLTGVQNNNTVNVGIEVIDKQDLPPRFLDTPVTITLLEGTPLNTVVGHITGIDGDTGNPRPVEVFILEDLKNLFKLGTTPQNGNMLIIVDGAIDREVLGDEYLFTAKVVELDNGTRTDQTAETVVSVRIIDVNDNPPRFKNATYFVNLQEQIGLTSNDLYTIPSLITVNDIDAIGNNAYTVSITGASVSTSYFRLDKTNGSSETLISIVVTNPEILDYEKPEFRDMTVNLRAQEINGPAFSDATVNIRLIDLNDNAPQFITTPSASGAYEAQLQENSPVGTFVMRIQATDADSGLNGRVVYSMSGTEFRVNSTTGEIFLAKPLDYETSTLLERTFTASDSAVPPKRINSGFRLNITNYNDQRPVFSPSYYTSSVLESANALRIPVRVQATDIEGDTMTYSIIGGNTLDNAFVINPVTGVVSLQRQVNYNEATNGYFVLIVEARDSGVPSLRSTTNITIEVVDENDKTPAFLQSVYNATISEISAPGTTVAVISAVDGDAGSNGEITYHIDSGGFDNFAIADPQRLGIVIVSPLNKMNFDEVKSYTVILHARDKGGPPKTGSATLYVTITDANNQLPEFVITNYQESIKEDEPVGTSVKKVEATDPDSTSSLRYSIKQGSHKARNSDGSNIIGLFPYDFTSAFRIEPTTGIIRTNQTLNRESAAEIEFVVVVEDIMAEDPKPQTAEASVLVIILGTGDITPYWEGKRGQLDPRFFFQIPENTQNGSLITSLRAIDPDGVIDIVDYVKVPGSGDPDNLFRIERVNGRIYVNGILDYEKLQNKLQSFKVRATTNDNTRSVDATVEIQIRDVNDNLPIFDFRSYNFKVPENKDHTYPVGYVAARDADSGSFSSIEYSLYDPANTDFKVVKDQNNQGLILINENVTLDFEKVQTYNLIVFAIDNLPTSTDRQTSSVKVTVEVTDINDNVPQFTRATYSFFTVETFSIGNSVGEVSATDEDGGNFGSIEYSLHEIQQNPKNATSFFEIEAATGLIKIRRNLQGTSSQSPFIMIVKAVDNPNGSPQLANSTTVHINVSSGQIDEGRPTWISPRLGEIVAIPENSNADFFVIQAVAFPRTPGATTVYSVLYNDDSRLFKIDNKTGVVTTNAPLDREAKETYSLLLLAVDSKNGSLSSTRLLTVQLLDENDELPSFSNCKTVKYARPEIVPVYENQPQGTFVFQARACDLDNHPYNLVSYSFYFSSTDKYCFENATEYFRLDSNTGIITTADHLDREKQASYVLCIRANQFNLRKKRQAYNFTAIHTELLILQVNVLDVNDNRPVMICPNKLLTERIFDLPKSDKIVQVQATDTDSPEFNRIRYSITKVRLQEADGRILNFNTPFNINPTTGQISVALKSYKPYVGGHFNITVRAQDYRNISMWDYCVVQVFVIKDYYQARVVIPTERFGDDVQGYVDRMLVEMNNAYPGYLFKDTTIRYHKTITGTTISKTDVCMIVIRQQQVLDSYQAKRELDSVKAILDRYGVVETGPCEPVSTSRLEGWVSFWWVLVAFAIFIFIMTIILIIVVWILYQRYKHYMETHRTYMVQ